MRAILLLSIYLMSTTGLRSQNLVLNGDFGQMIGCPTALSMIDSATFWHNATINGTPDFYHQCGNPFFAGVPVNGTGYQAPHSGEAYGGVYIWIGNNYREYMIGELSSPLIAGTCYHFEMYMSLGHYFKNTASNMGVYFSDTMITGILGMQMQNFTPQVTNPPGAYPDTTSWMPMTGNFTAAGGESFIVIGNFDTDANIDSMQIHPMALWPGAYVYIDDISLTVCTGIDEHNPADKVHVYPNPVEDFLFVETSYAQPAEIIIYNYTSQEVHREWFTGSTKVDLTKLKAGVYFYRLRSEQEKGDVGKIFK